jgi:carboxypeptidase Taq
MLNEAVACTNDCESAWVLQKATRLPVAEFPIVGKDGRVFNEPYYHVMGFAPTDNGLGIMCRVSQKQVVNVAQHGGMAAVLVGHPPHELKMPKRPVVHAEKAEETLRKQIAELQHLDHAIAVLEWDEETSLPPLGHQQRGEQLATLECLRHGMLTSDQLGDLIEEVARHNEGDQRWTRELELLRGLRVSEISLPKDLVRQFAEVKSRAQGAWEEAREKNDFNIFAPSFDEMLGVLRETAQALDGEADPYDVLMDEYEPGMTRAKLEPVLQELRAKLVPLVAGAAKKPNGINPLAARTFSEDKHWALARKTLETVGFDFERGRLDKAVHSGTSAVGFDDVRVSLSVRDSLTRTILTTMHEAGHGLYDQGYADADRGTLLAAAPSMGLHEGLARLWENHVGRSAAFWRTFYPTVRETLGTGADGLDDSAFFRDANRIAAGTHRASADELSYHLHILLRYEIEVALISGALKVKDLPAAWNEKSKALLGVAPASARDGVLQDGHWSSGMFGYFPTYTIGTLYAAQLVEAYERDHRLVTEIAHGDFKSLNDWLSRNIYAVGDRLTADEIITNATGTGLNTAAFFRHVETVLGA